MPHRAHTEVRYTRVTELAVNTNEAYITRAVTVVFVNSCTVAVVATWTSETRVQPLAVVADIAQCTRAIVRLLTEQVALPTVLTWVHRVFARMRVLAVNAQPHVITVTRATLVVARHSARAMAVTRIRVARIIKLTVDSHVLPETLAPIFCWTHILTCSGILTWMIPALVTWTVQWTFVSTTAVAGSIVRITTCVVSEFIFYYVESVIMIPKWIAPSSTSDFAFQCVKLHPRHYTKR